MRIVKRMLVGTVATAAVISGAVAAQAVTSLSELSTDIASTEIPKHGHVAVRAVCAPGTELISGGFSAPDRVYAGGGPYTDIQGGYRVGDRTFVVKADNQAFRTGHVYSFAYCGDLGGIEIAEGHPVELGSYEDGTATAHCPDGLTAVSGGWRGVAPDRGRPAMVPFRSKRAGTDGWKVSAKNQIFKGSEDLIAFAYCADTETPPTVAVNRFKMEGFNQFGAGVSCPAGSQAIAGGFDTATRHGHSIGSYLGASHRKDGGTRWKVTIVNGNDPRKAKVYAYCVPLTG
jgi:hypothetical protein